MRCCACSTGALLCPTRKMCAPQDVHKTLSEYGVKGSSRILVLQQATAAQKKDLDAATDRQERNKRLKGAVDKMAGRSASRSQRSLVPPPARTHTSAARTCASACLLLGSGLVSLFLLIIRQPCGIYMQWGCVL